MVILASHSAEDLLLYNPDAIWKIFRATGRLMPTLQDLHQAIRFRDIRKVQALASCSTIRINSSIRSCTALSLAVYQGDLTIVRVILSKGAEVDKLSRDWNHRIETPLFSACRLGHVNIAQTLIEHGASVNSTDFYNHSPLWIATRERNLDLVQLLIANGADLNTADKWSQCPLYLATKFFGREPIARTLVQHGCKLDLTDLDGRGAFYWALVNGLEDIVKLLIKAGVHVSLKDRDKISGRNPTSMIQEKPEMAEFLRKQLSNPPSLTNLCVRAIRHRLNYAGSDGKSIWARVVRLPVPETMKSHLKLL